MLFDKVFIVINYNTLIKRGTETWKNSMFCKLKKKSIIKFLNKNMLILLQKYKNYSVVYQFFLNYIINCICWLSATCINPFLTIMFRGPCHCREWGIIHCRINGVKQAILIHLRQQDIGRIIATIFMEICVKIISQCIEILDICNSFFHSLKFSPSCSSCSSVNSSST